MLKIYKTGSYTFDTTAYNNGLSNASIRNKNIYDTINVFDPNGTSFTKRYDIPYLAPNLLTTSPIQRTGVYVQDLIGITSKIKLLAGVRYSIQQNQQATVDTLPKDTRGYVKAYTTRHLVQEWDWFTSQPKQFQFSQAIPTTLALIRE